MKLTSPSNPQPTKLQLPDLIFRALVLVIIAIPLLALWGVARQPLTFISALVGVGATLLLIPVLLVLILRWVNPPTSALMLQKRFGLGGMVRPTGKLQAEWVSLAELPTDLQLAAIVAEDINFPLHFGFDFESLRSAYEYNKDHAQKRGGSTLTQQLAKNLFLWPDASYVRKIIEAYFTILMEGLLPKRRILELYLNIVRLDLEIFGVGAAARILLGKPVGTLSRHECALMVSAIASPLRFQLAAPSPAMRYRQTIILARMKKMGDAYLDLI